MKRHLIFPALAFVAAIGTSTIAGLCIDPSTEVSDVAAAQASGGAAGCAYWNSGAVCGYGGSNGCEPYMGMGSGTTSYGTGIPQPCGVTECCSVYTIKGCATTTTTTTVTVPD